MSDLLDPSIIVRCLTGVPPDLVDVGAQVMDGVAPLLVTDVVIVETADIWYPSMSYRGRLLLTV